MRRQYLPCFDQFAWLDCWNHVTGRGRRVASYCSVSSPPETIVLANISQKTKIRRLCAVLQYIVYFSGIPHFHSVFVKNTYCIWRALVRKEEVIQYCALHERTSLFVTFMSVKNNNKLVHAQFSEAQLRN